jgi:hypothetical protein
VASFSLGLYSPEFQDRQQLLSRLESLPNYRNDRDGPDMGWSGNVHWRLGTVEPYLAEGIRSLLDMAVGPYYFSLTVFQADDEIILEKWERIVDLLEPGEDCLALYQSSEVILVQRDGKLALDSQSGYLSEFFRNHVLQRRQAEIKPLGYLPE